MHVNPENVSRMSYAIANGLETGGFVPTVYIIEPISRCNLKCVMCPNPQMDATSIGEMEFEKFKHIIDEISPYAEFVMLYWMGEPTLHSQFAELMNYARSRIRGKIVVSTNMTVGSNSVAEALVASADIVVCSLDRWRKESYEKIRRGASFDNVRINIENLLAMRNAKGSRTEIVVKALDLSHGTPEYENFVVHWEAAGARVLFAWLNDWAGTFPGMRNAASLATPMQGSSRVPCADLWFKMTMNWRGEVQLCCFDWRYSHLLGTFDEGNWLKTIWHGDPIIEARRKHLQRDFNSIDLCKGCETWAEPSEHDAYVNWDDRSYFTVF